MRRRELERLKRYLGQQVVVSIGTESNPIASVCHGILRYLDYETGLVLETNYGEQRYLLRGRGSVKRIKPYTGESRTAI